VHYLQKPLSGKRVKFNRGINTFLTAVIFCSYS